MTERPANLQEHFAARCGYSGASVICEHLETLVRYGKEVDVITEFGVEKGASTCCWLLAEPKKLTCYDINLDNLDLRLMYESFAKDKGIDFRLVEGDSHKIEIEETDLLFIDTIHRAPFLQKELNLHAGKVRKYIICHDTECAMWPGLRKGITDFLEVNTEWRTREHYPNNNGLTVLERIDIGNYQEKGRVSMETQERTGTPGIVIHSAMYGIGGDRSIDVTEEVAELVAGGCDSVVASNDNFKDPSVGMRKQLTVKYSVDGVDHDETVAENETITFVEPEPRVVPSPFNADDFTETIIAPTEPAGDIPEPEDLSNVAYSKLQSRCKKAGLPANGSKEDLIERLTKPVEPTDTQE